MPAVDSTALPDTLCAWTRNLGHIMIRNVEVEIGGQRIDRQYGEWLTIFAELTLQPGLVAGYAEMIGNTADMFTFSNSLPAKTLYIPLQFWFNRNPGLALPLIALQYHEVKINIEFRPLSNLLQCKNNELDQPEAGPTGISMQAASLYVDYVYLDTDERRRFAQVSHEYLIEQLQYTGEESISNAHNKIRLNFNHPVKELVWVARLASAEANNQWSNFTTGVLGSEAYAGGNPMIGAKLQLNGHDRFSWRQSRYFNLVQPYQHHTNIPATGIYVYSFGWKPEEHQPSGTANFSRIDNATFQMTFLSGLFTTNLDTSLQQNGYTTINLLIYAVNYNVLRIMSGMGGLAYSN